MVLEKLLPYQVGHVLQLQEALSANQCVLDASDTGTGKTYCALALCALMNLEPLIICPKSVIPSWISVAKSLGVTIFGIANYELLKGGKYYTSSLEAVDCPFIDKIEKKEEKEEKLHKLKKKVEKISKLTKKDTNDTEKNKVEIKEENEKQNSDKKVDDTDKDTSSDNNAKKKKSKSNKVEFLFQFPKNVIVIFDEAHRCKNFKTLTSRMLIGASEAGNKVVLLSATITDKIQCFKPFGVVFNLYNDVKNFNIWVRRQINMRKADKDFCDLDNDSMKLKLIHDTIFPKKGSRLKISELGGLFPENQVVAKCYHSDNTDEITELYNVINQALADLKNKEVMSEGLGKIIRARQKIEMFKIPIIMDLAQEAIDNGQSVAIFVNFKETMYQLALNLETDCLIHGDQGMDERQSCIDDFQSNKRKIIIAIIQAGGVGISLHDIHGGHQRMSIISPTWSGQDLVQCLGRIHRAGAKSPALQRIVFCAGTCEDKICQTIQDKMTNIKAINNGDISPVKIKTDDLEIIEENVTSFNDKKKEIEEKFKDDKETEKPIKLVKPKSVHNVINKRDGIADDISETIKKKKKK